MPEDKKPESQRGLLSSMARSFSPREFRRITQEMYSQNLELVQLNKTLSLLNSIDRIVLQPDGTIKAACKRMTDAVIEEYGTCAVAAIFAGHTDGYRAGTLLASSCSWLPGVDQAKVEEFIGTLAVDQDFSWPKQKTSVYTDKPEIISKLLSIRKVASDADLTKQLRVGHYYAAQLIGSHGVIGTLVIGLREENAGQDEKLLGRISEAISVALDNKLLQEENEKILQRLQRSNAKLRKLDQTKDDFISMASHQLRTPLTSVKGYVSMVLDGDAGKITGLQRKLLAQSFVSSQRMVYLISDLLNVSRLRTGKFVIEPVESHLDKVVAEEVEQLVETAKGRHLTLTYNRPENFPALMLDETKLRQVMMNFIDNAVYYTPSGGHIEINLVNKPQSIEFTVVDDGIGVPKPDQHHLFTKFFRANNAKRARPDGTGLGLFMAKKVIIAQGGATIFKSQEGRGSTFGFIFSKKALHATEAPAQAQKK